MYVFDELAFPPVVGCRMHLGEASPLRTTGRHGKCLLIVLFRDHSLPRQYTSRGPWRSAPM